MGKKGKWFNAIKKAFNSPSKEDKLRKSEESLELITEQVRLNPA
jgi:hypothetical protein